MGPKRLKIGQKINEGEDLREKRFTNGHKSFTAAEAKALTEGYRAEANAKDRFDNTMHTILRPRDPIIGGEGEPQELLLKQGDSYNDLLGISRSISTSRSIENKGMPKIGVPRPGVSGKIGVPEYGPDEMPR